MTIYRTLYLLENAISYLEDNELLYDFTTDRDIDWTMKELSYFNVSAESIGELSYYGKIEEED